MQEYQERVVVEKKDLDTKIINLAKIIGNEVYASVPADERARLAEQIQHMRSYSEVLGQRIAAFVKEGV
jgi:ubiquinone biosynthesis protein UbiJ